MPTVEKNWSVRLSLPVVSLIRVVKMFPGISSAKLLNCRRRHLQLFRPERGRMFPPIPGGIPVFQHGQSFLLGHAGMGRFLTLQPDIVSLPPARCLDGPREPGSSITQAVVPNLIDSEVGESPGDLGIGVSFLGEVAPDDNNCSGWFGHIENVFRFALLMWFPMRIRFSPS